MTTTLIQVLRALGQRVRVKDKDVSPAAAVVGEVGVALSRADATDLRRLLSAVAGVREQLEAEKGSFEQKPVDALTDADSHTFLAGAMWAASEFLQARIDDLRAAEEALSPTSERAALRELVLALLREAETALTPSAISAAAQQRGLHAGADRVSKALSDLMRTGAIATAEPAPGADRRYRHFVLAHPERESRPQTPPPDQSVPRPHAGTRQPAISGRRNT